MRTCTVVVISSLLLSFCSQASAQWVQMSLPYSDIRCFATSRTNLFVGTYGGGVFLSSNSGDSWQPVNGDLTDTLVLALATDGSHLFAGTRDSGVFLSTNNGTHWTPINTGLTSTQITALAVITNGQGGENLLAGTSRGIFLSTNDGASWIPGLLWNGGGPFLIIPANRATGGVIVLGVIFAGGEFGGNGIWRSSDYGINWSPSGNGMPEFGASIPTLAASPNGGEKLFAAENSHHHIYHSTNGGLNWIVTSATVWDILSFAVFPNLDQSGGLSLLAGTRGSGVFRSRDDGATWIDVSAGLPPNSTVHAFVVHGQYLFAGTATTGLWKRPLSEIVTSVNELSRTTTPSLFALEQNYPNPFNPSTNIKWQIAHSRFVTLKVYDILGREVRTLVNENLQAGSYETTFDATGLASGVYFYRLRTSDFVQTKKLVLLR